MDAIRTEALAKSFDGLGAVDNLTLTVAEGEIFGLVGLMVPEKPLPCDF